MKFRKATNQHKVYLQLLMDKQHTTDLPLFDCLQIARKIDSNSLVSPDESSDDQPIWLRLLWFLFLKKLQYLTIGLK